MPNNYGKCSRDFGAFLFLLVSTFLYFGGVFNKTIILLALVGYEMIIANSALRASLAIYIPLTNRVRGPYRKLRTEFFPPRFMAQARSARAINRRGKNEDP